MPEPRYVISMGDVRERRWLLPLLLFRGARVSTGSFQSNIYVPGCPPTARHCFTVCFCCKGRFVALPRLSADPISDQDRG
jgi:Ni,Fe-hydrogenase III small subunit